MASPTLGKGLLGSGKEKHSSAETSLKASETPRAHVSKILEHIRDGVFSTDLHGNITGWNNALLAIFQLSPEDLQGKNLSLLYPEKPKGLSGDSILATVLNEGRYQGEVCTRTKSGKEIFVFLSLSRSCGEDLTPTGIAGVAIDITEQKLLSLALQQGRPKANGSSGSPGLVERQIDGARFLIASSMMHKFMVMVDRTAGSPEMVLITGETGTGKELIARSIHDNSPRRNQAWVDINCAALPENLVESELFGYEKGAFSGADSAKPGLFELANKGTLLLDEIGELDPKLQVKLLRVLDGAPYYRLGGHRKIAVDVRVVAATNQNLELAVEHGRFRRDLFHRLGQLQLRVPPLRERPEDIVALAEHFLFLKDKNLMFSPGALSALASYQWPGNVRELRNLVAKLAMAAVGSEISVDDLLLGISIDKPASQPALLPTNLEGMEEAMIIKALESNAGHRGLAAEQLGISRRTLSRKLREFNITSPEHGNRRPLGTMGSEQQKLFRAKASFVVRLQTTEGHEANVTAVNLSTGGLGFEGLVDAQKYQGLLDASFLLPESETLIQAKVRIVWADASGKAGARFVVLDPALFDEIQHWTLSKINEEGWESSQTSGS